MSTQVARNALKDMPFGPHIMMDIVKLLNEVNIPSILWGTSLLDIYGVPTGDIDMDFIIDRRLIKKAGEQLSYAGLNQCTSQSCWSRAPTAKDDFTLSNGVFHYHLAPNWLENIRPSVQLHIRDERIWTLPTDDNPVYTDNENIVFASDERFLPPNWNTLEGNNPSFGRCRHYPGSPVRVLTPECYINALVLLMVRDGNTKTALNWCTQISYMGQYKLFDLENIHPVTRTYVTTRNAKERLKKATLALGDVANKGRLLADWHNGQ